MDASYEFAAVSADGDMIVGVAQAGIVDRITAPEGSFVDLHDIQINGYSSGSGGTNV